MAPDRSGAREESSELARRRQSGGKTETASGGEAPAHPILRLQRQVGNAQVSRMLAQRQAIQRTEADEESEELNLKRVPNIQRVATEEEQEEEKGGAVNLMRTPDIQRTEATEEEGEQVHMMRMSNIQRTAAPDEEGEENLHMLRSSDIQRTASAAPAPEVGLEGGPVSNGLASQIQSKAGTGSKLPDPMIEKMQPHFSNDLSKVDVVQGNGTDTIHNSLMSQAFATGSSVFLSRNASVNDPKLMAHELTHLELHQGGSSGGGMTVSAADSTPEREADAKADEVSRNIG